MDGAATYREEEEEEEEEEEKERRKNKKKKEERKRRKTAVWELARHGSWLAGKETPTERYGSILPQRGPHPESMASGAGSLLAAIPQPLQRPRPDRGRPLSRGHPQQPPVVTATADEDQSAAGLGGARVPRSPVAGRLRPGGLHRGPRLQHADHQDLEPEPQHADDGGGALSVRGGPQSAILDPAEEGGLDLLGGLRLGSAHPGVWSCQVQKQPS